MWDRGKNGKGGAFNVFDLISFNQSSSRKGVHLLWTRLDGDGVERVGERRGGGGLGRKGMDE